jgi:hypothetical protein
VDQDTLVSRTPTVAPGSLARERALSRKRRVKGPQKLLGPPMERVNAWSEDHVKMQRPLTCAVTVDGVTKRWATQRSPRRQTVMMVRHFAAECCADALIPVLRFDASMPAAPFKCSLLGSSDTSSSFSSTTSPSDASPSDGSLCFLRRCPLDLAQERSATGAPPAAGTK